MKDSLSKARTGTAPTAKLLATICPDLSSGLRQDEAFLRCVQGYLAAPVAPADAAAELTAQTDEGFVDLLEGVKIIVQAMKLTSVDELLAYLQAKKQAHRACTFAPRPAAGAPVPAPGQVRAVGPFQLPGLGLGNLPAALPTALGRLQEVEDTLQKIDPKEQAKLSGGNRQLAPLPWWRPRLAG